MKIMRTVGTILFVAAGFFLALVSISAAEITAEPCKEGVVIKIDGKLFARYIKRSGTKPILWPIIGPTGKPMTRAYPMTDAGKHESAEFIHHRSLWFGLADVNDVNFWSEEGIIRHREFVKIESGPQAVVVARNDWLTPDFYPGDQKKVIEDERTLTFGADAESRWIDFDIVLTASEGEVLLGGVKDAGFGVQVAGTMKVDAGMGGRIVNSRGHTNKDAWGKQAEWLDCHGPVDGQTVGIAILNHPSSFRFPTYWHVRTYGLMLANPFGLWDFTRGKKDGDHVLPAGESICLRHRVFLHKGDAKSGRVAEAFAAYAKQTKPSGATPKAN